MRGAKRLFAGGLALLTAAAALQVAPEREAAASRFRVRTQDVAPGLKLHRIRDSRGPNQIRVLEMAPNSTLALDVALARDRIPWLETTGSMGRRRGALAAINGDYTLGQNHNWTGRPVHAFAHDARMATTEMVWGRNVGINEAKRVEALGRAQTRGTLAHPGSGRTWRINRWNDVLQGNGVGAYTPDGGGHFKPPRNACAIRLFPEGELVWSDDGRSVEQQHVVNQIVCRAKRLGRKGGTVVATPRSSNKGAQFRQNVARGDVVSVSWTTGWNGIVETIGGNPTLLEDGKVVAQCQGSNFCRRHPRTGVGIRPDGTILLVTVDGRRKGSVGHKPVGFARLFRWLGANWALNLDGGGSTTMWVRGQGTVNVPSGGGKQRAVGSALMILPAPDPNEPTVRQPQQDAGDDDQTSGSDIELPPLPPRKIAGAPLMAHPAATTCRALDDPASTGGLLDALARGSFVGGPGGRGRVPPGLPTRLTEALDVFRGRTSCAAYLTD